jgi:hypothetical protein
MKLCTHDPLLALVYDHYHAHPIRVPEARVAPLSVFFRVKSDHLEWIGPLAELVDENTRAQLSSMEPPYKSAMADVTATRSSEMDTSLGLEILGGFLAAFGGLTGLPAVSVQCRRFRKMSFAFNDTVRVGYSPAKLGAALPSQPFAADNQIVVSWLATGRAPACYVVDSVLMSNEFTIMSSSATDTAAELSDVPINALLGAEARVSVSGSGGTQLSFRGSERLPFALTCLQVTCLLDEGKIRWEPFLDPEVFLRPPDPSAPPPTALLSDVPMLLEWDTGHVE